MKVYRTARNHSFGIHAWEAIDPAGRHDSQIMDPGKPVTSQMEKSGSEENTRATR